MPAELTRASTTPRAGALHADWPASANVRTAITLRSMHGISKSPYDACNLGTRCGDDPAAVAANRAELIAALDLPEPPRWLHQVHGREVFAAGAPSLADKAEPQADAAVAHAAGTVLAVLTADCLPLLLCAEDGSAIGIAHAGWRGLAAGVIEAAVVRLAVPADYVLAWLGPAIGPCSYEVGEEVRDVFVGADGQAAAAFAPTRPGHWLFDLYALARQRLASMGVRRVFGGAFDTYTDPRFYSYRRDRETGRFASLIWIVPAP